MLTMEAHQLLSTMLAEPSSAASEHAKSLQLQFAALEPSRSDYSELFKGRAAAAAHEAYAAAWENKVFVPRLAGATQVRVWGATWNDLRERTGDAEQFPRGWKLLTRHLQRDIVVFAYRFEDDHEAIVAGGDGLVRLKSGWRLFPSPYIAIPSDLAPEEDAPEKHTPEVGHTEDEQPPAKHPEGAKHPQNANASREPSAARSWIGSKGPPRSPVVGRIDIQSLVHPLETHVRNILAEDVAFTALQKTSMTDAVALSTRMSVVRHNIRLTQPMAPELFAQLALLSARLGCSEKFELFVHGAQTVGAYVAPRARGAFALSISAGAIEKLTPGEIGFLLGHEIGHAQLKHHELANYKLRSAEGVPARIRLWAHAFSRCAELTADRVGMVACGSLRDATTALFKMATGLTTARYTKHGASETFSQYLELGTYADFGAIEHLLETHPYNPIRLRELDTFACTKLGRKLLPHQARMERVFEADHPETEFIKRLVLPDMEVFTEQADAVRSRFYIHVISRIVYNVLAEPDAPANSSTREQEAVKRLLPDLVVNVDEIDVTREFAPTDIATLKKLPTIVKIKMMENLAMIAAGDRLISDYESDELLRAGTFLGMPPESVLHIVTDVRARLD